MMLLLLSDAKFDSLTSIFLGLITIIPATLAALYARSAKKDSSEAKQNSADTLHEIATNGGMADPNPNLNDHVKYQTEMTEWLVESVKIMQSKFDSHLEHSKVMDQALAEVYMEVRPKPLEWPKDDPT